MAYFSDNIFQFLHFTLNSLSIYMIINIHSCADVSMPHKIYCRVLGSIPVSATLVQNVCRMKSKRLDFIRHAFASRNIIRWINNGKYISGNLIWIVHLFFLSFYRFSVADTYLLLFFATIRSCPQYF